MGSNCLPPNDAAARPRFRCDGERRVRDPGGECAMDGVSTAKTHRERPSTDPDPGSTSKDISPGVEPTPHMAAFLVMIDSPDPDPRF